MTPLFGVIIIIILFVIQALFIIFLPYLVADRIWLTLNQSLFFRYGGMNTPKTVCLFVVQGIIAISCIIAYLISPSTSVTIGIAVAYVISSLFLFRYFPQHAAFDLVDYGDVKNPKTYFENEYVTFLGVGDIQLFSDMKERLTYNNNVIDNINKFMDTVYKTLPGKNGEIMGVVTPGDCTQTGQDGRLFTHNELGVYETNFGLGGHSPLKLPVYECNGNHDYDVYGKFLFSGNIPSVNMINRKNKFRSIVDHDKKGNYMWVWDGVYFIALNVWPSKQKLLNGRPDGSLEFLRKCVINIPFGEKFFILTHYVPNVLGWDLQDFYHSDTFKGTPCEPLLEVIRNRERDLVAIMIGHNHLWRTWRRVNKDGIQIIILPSPIESEGAFAFMRYHKSSNTLYVSDISSSELIEKPVALDKKNYDNKLFE
jgi:hypothetical protein